MLRLTVMAAGLFLLCGCAQSYYNVATDQEETYFYSTDKEVKVGQSFSRQVEKQFKVLNDPLVQQRINDIGQKIAKGCDRKEINYYFKVLDEKEINAFALPGGYVYMFKGLWDKLDNDDARIAAVLSHEVAHIAARHSIKRLQSSMGYNALAILVATSSSMDGYSKAKAMAGINELILSYSREDEMEADRLATRYMQNAGYDFSKMTDVIEVLEKTQKEKPISGMHWRTHPYFSERKKIVNQEKNRGNIKFDDYINTSQ